MATEAKSNVLLCATPEHSTHGVLAKYLFSVSLADHTYTPLCGPCTKTRSGVYVDIKVVCGHEAGYEVETAAEFEAFVREQLAYSGDTETVLDRICKRVEKMCGTSFVNGVESARGEKLPSPREVQRYQDVRQKFQDALGEFMPLVDEDTMDDWLTIAFNIAFLYGWDRAVDVVDKHPHLSDPLKMQQRIEDMKREYDHLRDDDKFKRNMKLLVTGYATEQRDSLILNTTTLTRDRAIKFFNSMRDRFIEDIFGE